MTHPNKETRKLITKFRLSDHDLFIEKGRYLKVKREERKCKKCDLIEDEIHFFLKCKNNQNKRKDLFEYFENAYPDFNSLNDIDKLKKILNPSNHTDINMVVSFIKQSYELRRGDS